MSHLAIRSLISDTVKSLDDSVLFAYARASDFNSLGKKEDKRVRLDPFKEVIEFTEGSYNFTKTFKVGIVFYKLDVMAGAEEETTSILDDMDLLSDSFLNKLNLYSFNEDTTKLGTQQIELKNITKEPVIKVTADLCSGFVLQFDMIVPDQFNYCSIY